MHHFMCMRYTLCWVYARGQPLTWRTKSRHFEELWSIQLRRLVGNDRLTRAK